MLINRVQRTKFVNGLKVSLEKSKEKTLALVIGKRGVL